jgi:peptide deformylase
VRAWDRRGKDLAFEVKGLTAGTFQHEVDHIDGTLFIDSVANTRSLATLVDFERFHREAFVERAKALIARFGS